MDGPPVAITSAGAAMRLPVTRITAVACSTSPTAAARDVTLPAWRIPRAASPRSARRAVAEELAERLFVPGDAVAIDQIDEVLRA
jgi:hypothetical protein